MRGNESYKIGQLLFIGIAKYYLDSETIKLIKEIQPGGIILLKRNIQSLHQLIDLIKSLKNVLKIIPFIGIDQEGGKVQRLYGLFPFIPSLKEISSNYSLISIRKINYRIAQALKILGINTNFHPVVDLIYEGNDANKLNDRCISSNARRAAKVAGEILKAYSQAGIFCCFKHYPGLGCTLTDSHFELPTCPLRKEQLWENDLLPYRMHIEKIPIIMVGHCYYPMITKDKISSISLDLIYGLLRREMKYQGLIITDDLEMGAIVKMMKTTEAAVESLKAGCDMAMICHSYEDMQKAFEEIYLESSRDSGFKDIIEEKINRILKYKSRIESVEGDIKRISSLFNEISTILSTEKEI